jgi:hypothetical protein
MNHDHSIHTGEDYDQAEHLAQAHGRQSAHLATAAENDLLAARLCEGCDR